MFMLFFITLILYSMVLGTTLERRGYNPLECQLPPPSDPPLCAVRTYQNNNDNEARVTIYDIFCNQIAADSWVGLGQYASLRSELAHTVELHINNDWTKSASGKYSNFLKIGQRYPNDMVHCVGGPYGGDPEMLNDYQCLLRFPCPVEH